MTQFKDKSAKTGTDRIGVGVFTYPMLMAADILLYQANQVPVGEDQRQHIELTRDLAGRFNHQYGQTFVIPEGFILKAGAKIYDLQDPSSKMSKSAESLSGLIEILDEPAVNTKKIKSAVTDTGREITFDSVNKPGISNLLTIFSALSGESIASIESQFAGKGYGDFKKRLFSAVWEYFAPMRERRTAIASDPAELDRILKDGAEQAAAIAQPLMDRLRKAIGLR